MALLFVFYSFPHMCDILDFLNMELWLSYFYEQKYMIITFVLVMNFKYIMSNINICYFRYYNLIIAKMLL